MRVMTEEFEAEDNNDHEAYPSCIYIGHENIASIIACMGLRGCTRKLIFRFVGEYYEAQDSTRPVTDPDLNTETR